MAKTPKEYFLEDDFNCAETTLRALNDAYDLGISEDEMKLVGGFGGGLGCGKTCGILCGAVAGIGRMMISERAHATENLKETCAGCVAKFEEKFGSTDCETLKSNYFDKDTRCLYLVENGIELVKDYIENTAKENRKV